MNTFLIALGSNLGDRKYYIDQAVIAIGTRLGKVTDIAKVLETEPIGAADQSFFNTAILCETRLDPEAALSELLRIEIDLGRVRAERWGNRTIDCDIILWRAQDGSYPGYKSGTLVIPHPEALSRDFVLGPAAEIAGDWLHADNELTLQELWRKFSHNARIPT
jgi:2-amino-4-hydroxy-6-hydroxymethyldihydropteridine diphosphokinase